MRDPVTIEADDESVPALLTRLVEETRQLAGAEVALIKVRVGSRVTAYRSAAIFFAVAGVLALAAVIALLVGAILTLATRVGPGWATVIVVVVTLLIAGVLGFVGSNKLKPVEPA